MSYSPYMHPQNRPSAKTSKTVTLPLGWIAVVITAVLITLKVTGVATFSWWVAFLPLIIWAGLVILTIVLALLIMVIAAAVLKNKNVGR